MLKKFDFITPPIGKEISTSDQFYHYMRDVVLESDAAKVESIVYVWHTEAEFYRMKGKSNILYIGKTVNSLRDRYRNKNSLEIEKEYFSVYYKYAVEAYGPIKIGIINSEEPELDEKKLLLEYRDKHKELTPLNRKV